MSSLGYPLNEGQYHWTTAIVSLENFISGNSEFINRSFPTMVGVQGTYEKGKICIFIYRICGTGLRNHFICIGLYCRS